MKLSFALFVATAGIESVVAHGYVASIVANGVTYPGWAPFSDPYASAFMFSCIC
jgi:hypothetical protein